MKHFDATQLNEILGDLLLQPVPPQTLISAICTDTRQLSGGQTFAAVRGQRFDGHDFVETALNNGASALLVEKKQPAFVPQVVVRDTRLALGRLAAAIRDDFVARGGKVVGLTGSVGKTTNKQMLASILSQAALTHATKGNLNNDLGVPFTWFALSADAADNIRFAVIEMGANHQGEIAYLSAITRPQVALITNAADVHLQGFGGLDGVAKGKGELFASLRAGDTAVVNIDDHYADYWRSLLVDGVKVMTFSRNNAKADVFAADISADGSRFVLKFKEKQADINLPTLGRHQVINALGSAACALALNVSLYHISKGLAQFEGAKGRLQKIPCGQLNLIDDSYNASPASMRAAAELVAVQPGYRIMVLGDMAELGEDSHRLHCQLGKELADKADAFYCLGDKMQSFVSANDKAMHFAALPALMKVLIRQVNRNPTATVLVKGSRSMKMERVVNELLGRALKL